MRRDNVKYILQKLEYNPTEKLIFIVLVATKKNREAVNKITTDKIKEILHTTDNGNYGALRKLANSGIIKRTKFKMRGTESIPQFEKELKENILDYAKTVKSLNEDENLILQVGLTQCSGCEMPEQIDVTVRQSILKGYDSGKIKREEALNKISVKKGK